MIDLAPLIRIPQYTALWLNPSMNRPENAAPGGMRGSSRMYDPTEELHDRVRRSVINIAFVVIVLLNVAQLRLVGVHGWDWLSVLLMVIAAAPLGIAMRVLELRFKMATEERERMLSELPAKTKAGFAVYAILSVALFVANALLLTWALLGIWLYDFVTYYHDRPERIRHVYAVAKTLDELRDFPAPWAWAVPALVWTLIRQFGRF
jgi:hypothetical protein